MAFIVYIVVFSICIWFGNLAAKIANRVVGVIVAAVLPFALVFVFTLLYSLLGPLLGFDASSSDIAGDNSLNTVLYAFLATPGALIAVIVSQMAWQSHQPPQAKQ